MEESLVFHQAKEFLAAYYKIFTYDSANINKFYAENAMVWRQSLQSPLAVSIQAIQENLVPAFNVGSDISVESFR